jgi:hypothetical protein
MWWSFLPAMPFHSLMCAICLWRWEGWEGWGVQHLPSLDGRLLVPLATQLSDRSKKSLLLTWVFLIVREGTTCFPAAYSTKTYLLFFIIVLYMYYVLNVCICLRIHM